MRDHYDYHQALRLVGIFNLDKWLFNHALELEKKRAKMEKNSKMVSIFRFASIKDVVKTEITSDSFTHVSHKEMLYDSIYEPDGHMRESPTTRHTRRRPLNSMSLQSHEAIVAEEAEKEQAIYGITEALAKIHQEPEIITYDKRMITRTDPRCSPSVGFAYVRAIGMEDEEQPCKRMRTKTDPFAKIQDEIQAF